jgi:ferrous iron transport protein B
LTVSDRIDRVLTNRWLALPIFAAIMFSGLLRFRDDHRCHRNRFYQRHVRGRMGAGPGHELLSSIGTADWLTALSGTASSAAWARCSVRDQMLVLFLLLAILEDVATWRASPSSWTALSASSAFRQSFIPMLISSGCGVPGVMASRTIENDRDRKMTIMTTTFIPAGQDSPIVALIAGALFHNAGWVATSPTSSA